MAKDKGCDYPTPNDYFTTLPTKPTEDRSQGSLKHPLPTSSKYGPLKD